jgi:hypothetical protein
MLVEWRQCNMTYRSVRQDDSFPKGHFHRLKRSGLVFTAVGTQAFPGPIPTWSVFREWCLSLT